MHQTRILIVEDELIIAEDLKNKLVKSGYEVTEIVDNGEDALKSFKKNQPDLMLMDIQLKGEIDGIEISKEIRKVSQLPIIYLTHLTDSKTINKAKVTGPSAYILKPFKERDLNVAIELALFNASTQEEVTNLPEESDNYLLNDRIFIKVNHKFVRVDLDDILYLNADGAYTEFITSKAKFVLSENLNSFEAKLPFSQFVRVHRSWLINADHIDAFEEHEVIIDRFQIPIGKTYRQKFKKRFRFL